MIKNLILGALFAISAILCGTAAIAFLVSSVGGHTFLDAWVFLLKLAGLIGGTLVCMGLATVFYTMVLDRGAR